MASRQTAAKVALLVSLLASWLPQARGVHGSGSRYEVVGFSAAGDVLVRQVFVQDGARTFKLVAPDGRDKLVRDVAWFEHPDDVQNELREAHGISSVGFPGAAAPDRSAVVLVLPGILRGGGAFDYDVRLSAGAEMRSVASVPAPATCAGPSIRSRGDLSTHWAPDSSVAVLAGDVLTDAPCGNPSSTPVLVVVPVRNGAWGRDLAELVFLFVGDLEWLAHERPREGLALARQLLAVSPDSTSLLLLTARLRAHSSKAKEAISALWAVARLRRPGSRRALRDALAEEWTAPLRNRAAFRALGWCEQERLSRVPEPESRAADLPPEIDAKDTDSAAPEPSPQFDSSDQ